MIFVSSFRRMVTGNNIVWLLFIILSMISMGSSIVKGESNKDIISQISLTLGADYVASSVDDEIRQSIPRDEKIKINSALPVNLRYSFSFADSTIRNYYPGGYQGLSVGVLNFGAFERHGVRRSDRNIGYPVTAYIFQGAPFWHISDNLSLNYEWNFGAAIGWKPYSAANKYFNLAVGSQVNAYLHINLHFNWKLNPNLSLIAGAGVSHFSNGNTSFPNPGINSFGLRLGLIWTLNPIEKFPSVIAPYKLKTTPDSIQNKISSPDGNVRHGKKKLGFDIMAWGSTRKRVYRGGDTPVLLPGHFACAGVSVTPMSRLNTWWRVGGSLDIQYDHSAGMPKGKNLPIIGAQPLDKNIDPDADAPLSHPLIMQTDTLPGHPSFWRQVSVGLSAHGELQMPIFAINIGIGYNILAPWENRGSYQNIALKTYFCRNVFLNIGYQLRNFHQQSSLMLGLGVSL